MVQVQSWYCTGFELFIYKHSYSRQFITFAKFGITDTWLMVLLIAIKYRSSDFKLGANSLEFWYCSQIKDIEDINNFSTVSCLPDPGVFDA
jgi:hypothetical protein